MSLCASFGRLFLFFFFFFQAEDGIRYYKVTGVQTCALPIYNPFSESHFKTLKYRPEFRDRFGSLQHARIFCQEFFSWYNTEHHHSGLGLLTPEVVHSHRADQDRDLRQHTLDIAYAAHPERFVRKPPQPPALPTAVWINPPPKPESGPPDSEETVQ